MKYCELFLLLCLVSMNSWSGEYAISNAALGLYAAKKGEVTDPSGVIKYQSNAVCVRGGQEIGCLYYGISFDSKLDNNKMLFCDVRSEREIRDARKESESDIITREFELKADDNHFFIPGYILRDDGDYGIYELCFICQLDGQEVIRKRLLLDMGSNK